MSVTAEQLAAVKAYMRVPAEDTSEDAVIGALYESAQGYLLGAGVSEPPQGDPWRALYLTCLWGLTLWYYDHRDDAGDAEAFPLGLRKGIQQLKHLQEVDAAVAGELAEA